MANIQIPSALIPSAFNTDELKAQLNELHQLRPDSIQNFQRALEILNNFKNSGVSRFVVSGSQLIGLTKYPMRYYIAYKDDPDQLTFPMFRRSDATDDNVFDVPIDAGPVITFDINGNFNLIIL